MFGNLIRRLFRRSEKGEVRCESEEKGIWCEWNGQAYNISIQGVADPEEVQRRFAAYAPKAPVCVTCGRIILPGMPVSLLTPGRVLRSDSPEPIEITQEGLAHHTPDCAVASNFCGWVTEEGHVLTPFADGPSAADVVLKTGKGMIIGDINDPRSYSTFDVP